MKEELTTLQTIIVVGAGIVACSLWAAAVVSALAVVEGSAPGFAEDNSLLAFVVTAGPGCFVAGLTTYLVDRLIGAREEGANAKGGS